MNRREFLSAAAALPVALRAGTARAGGEPIALVTADLESRIVALSPVTGSVVGHIATPAGPRSVEAVGSQRAVVAHTSAGGLTIVDGRRVVADVDGFAEPRYTAAHPDGRHALVSDSRRGEVVIVDVARARIVARVDVGGAARHLSLTPTGGKLWVALGSKADRIVVVDTSRLRSPRVLAAIAPPFPAHDVGFVPGGREAWVTSGAENAVVIYDAWARRLLKVLRADAPPQHVTFTRSRVFVSSGDDNVVRVHAFDGRLLRTTPVPWGSYNVQQGLGRVLTPSLHEGTICVLDGRGALVHRERVARSSHDAALLILP